MQDTKLIKLKSFIHLHVSDITSIFRMQNIFELIHIVLTINSLT